MSRLRLYGECLKRRDAVLLARWWNRNRGTYFNEFRVVRSGTNPRYWDVVRG